MGTDFKHIRKLVYTALLDTDRKGEGIRTKHRAEFRASSGGVCARNVALTEWAKYGKGVPKTERRIESMLYTAIGTAVHEAVQQWLGYKRLLWGSWECRVCGKTWTNRRSPGRHCGQLVHYIEYSLVHPNPAIGEYGHADGILLVPMGLGYVVLELKTTSLRQAVIRAKEGPFRSARRQAHLYAEFFERGWARVIHRNAAGEVLFDKPARLPKGKCFGVFIIYIPRDRPTMKQWVPWFRRIKRGQIDTLEEIVPLTRKQIKRGVLPPPRCEQRSDARDEFWRWCPWTETCFSPNCEEIAEMLYQRYRRAKAKERKK